MPSIDLQQYRTSGSKVFTGRDRGREVRKKSNIDILGIQSADVTISIPPDIRSINPSFLEEFLQHVVLKLGSAGFYAKFHFDNPGLYKIDNDVREAVERILRTENALA